MNNPPASSSSTITNIRFLHGMRPRRDAKRGSHGAIQTSKGHSHSIHTPLSKSPLWLA
jgi:hypothetical protein